MGVEKGQMDDGGWRWYWLIFGSRVVYEMDG
jgi:hypothetical protein